MNYSRFCQLLEGFPKARIAVVGDMFLDKWLTVDRSLDELSLETGLTCYQVVAKRTYAGAAGTVMSNLAALDIGKIYAVGFTGDDGEGYEFRRACQKLGIDLSFLMNTEERLTPTYTKPMFRENGRETESNRLDFKNVGPTPAAIEDYIIESLDRLCSSGMVDAVIALDQLCDRNTGAITDRVREHLSVLAARYPQLFIYADSRAFIDLFRGVTVKCNDKEAQTIVLGAEREPYDLELVKKCQEKMSELAGKPAFVSCGSRGVLAYRDGHPVLVPTVQIEGEIDIVGAGDACSSGIVSAVCAGASPDEAAFVGNLTSSITIQVIGTTGTASREKLKARYREFFGEGEA